MKLRFTPFTLVFKHPFTIAAGTRSTTPIVLTEIDCEGLTGYGEASMPPYLGEDHQSVIRFLTKASKILADVKSPFDLENILQQMDKIDSGNTAAKASIDIALHDLSGKLLNQPCYTFWNLDKNNTPFCTYTIGIDKPEMVKLKIKESGDFKILKVKLGSPSDKLIIETIRSVTDKPIVVDVNQGWKDKHHALEMINWLKEKNILFIEQPMPKEKTKEMIWLKSRSPLPLIADESVQRISDLETIKDSFHGINIKLMKCTGMHEAYKMITRARELDLKVLIGCMSETACATSAAAHLTPLADWADLDGPLLIQNNMFEGIAFIEGKIVLKDLPGIGIRRIKSI